MGQPVKWYKKFKFLIEMDGVVRAAFHDCEGLKAVAAVVKYKEGGRRHPHKSPGTIEFPPLKMSRGVCKDFDLYNLWKATYDAASGTGLDEEDLYFAFDIVQQNMKGEEEERYSAYNNFVSEFDTGDWNNDSDEVRMEAITIEPDYWERVPA